MIRLRISFSKDLRQDRRRILPYPHDSSIKSGGRWCNLAINGDLLWRNPILILSSFSFRKATLPIHRDCVYDCPRLQDPTRVDNMFYGGLCYCM